MSLSEPTMSESLFWYGLAGILSGAFALTYTWYMRMLYRKPQRWELTQVLEDYNHTQNELRRTAEEHPKLTTMINNLKSELTRYEKLNQNQRTTINELLTDITRYTAKMNELRNIINQQEQYISYLESERNA